MNIIISNIYEYFARGTWVRIRLAADALTPNGAGIARNTQGEETT